jgi:hypothetical protein
MIGNNIFSLLNYKTIGEWDLKGKLIKEIKSDNNLPGQIPNLLGLGDFLVHICEKNIIIHDLQKESQKKIETVKSIFSSHLDSNYFDSNRLICGFTTSDDKNPNCCVIDMENGEITNQYRAEKAFEHYKIDYYDNQKPYLTESGTIGSIIANKEWVYLGHSTGTVVAVNLADKSHSVLGKHKTHVYYIALQGQILITGSDYTRSHSAELKFWDIKSLTKIAEFEFDSLNAIALISGKVFAAANCSLIQLDYNITHKGSKEQIDII